MGAPGSLLKRGGNTLIRLCSGNCLVPRPQVGMAGVHRSAQLQMCALAVTVGGTVIDHRPDERVAEPHAPFRKLDQASRFGGSRSRIGVDVAFFCGPPPYRPVSADL